MHTKPVLKKHYTYAIHKKVVSSQSAKKHSICPPYTSPHEMLPQQSSEESSCGKVVDNIRYTSTIYKTFSVCSPLEMLMCLYITLGIKISSEKYCFQERKKKKNHTLKS